MEPLQEISMQATAIVLAYLGGVFTVIGLAAIGLGVWALCGEKVAMPDPDSPALKLRT
jgi:hypothetical protein